MADNKSETMGTEENLNVPKQEGEKPDAVAPVASSKATTVDNQELKGLKENRDKILAEKKTLQTKYNDLLSANEAREKQELADQDKFKELYDGAEAKIKDMQAAHLLEIESIKTESEKKISEVNVELQTTQKLNEFNSLANKHNFDITYSKFVYQDAEWTDENGKSTIADPGTFFDSLKESKPAFFVNQPKIKTDATKTSPIGAKDHVFTRQEIQSMSIEEYKKNKDAILAQEKTGLNYGETK